MDRSRFLLTSLAAALVAPLAAGAQQAGKVHRLGFLGVGTAARFERQVEAIRLGLREHGYVEGRNVTHGAPGTLALKQATSTIPIVMAVIGNPVEVGAVASLARPGGNITGSGFLSEEVTAKRVDLLKATLPGLGRVGFLTNLDNVGTAGALRAVEQMAQALNVKVQPLEVRRLDELDAAITTAKKQIDALVVPDEQLFSVGSTPGRIADLALKSRMPSIGFTEYAESGGLIGYGVNFLDLWRRSIGFVDKILKGAKPADLPVEQTSKFQLVTNLKTAKALGITIPPSLLARADQVIERPERPACWPHAAVLVPALRRDGHDALRSQLRPSC